ncbi:MAG: carboxylesterase family protein, partial [Chitinophagaceae bacterium]
YGDRAAAALQAYPVSADEEVMQVATDLAADRFIGFSTWKWSDVQSKTGGKPVYRYLYSKPRPPMRAEMGNVTAGLAGGIIKGTDPAASKQPPQRGAVHSAEIEYALGNLPTNRTYDWQPEDYKVSEIMQAYFANFIKTGNPNGLGLPDWPAVHLNGVVQVMHLDVKTRVEPEKHRERYLFLEGKPANRFD